MQALVSYTWGKSLDNASNDSSSYLIAPAIVPKQDYGPSDFDIRQTLSAAFSYNIPGARFWKPSTHGWALDGVVSARTATPVDITYSADIDCGLYNWRPDAVPEQPLYIADSNVAGGKRFNPDAFETPNTYPGRQGTLERMKSGISLLDSILASEFPTSPKLLPILETRLWNAAAERLAERRPMRLTSEFKLSYWQPNRARPSGLGLRPLE